MSDKFMYGSSLLVGDNTVPGLQLPDELKKVIPDIFKACRDFGLDFYPTVIQMVTYDEMSELASYGGFPVRYPHWQWGMEYEEMQRGYMHGMHRIFEMVINSNPCYIYCLESNSLVDNVTVIAHALGHNDFFKNNAFFAPTTQNAMNELANHGTRIQKYIHRWGKERVYEFIDHCLRIQTLVDFAHAWQQRQVKDPIIVDSRTWRHPKKLHVADGHEYMDPHINTDEWNKRQRRKVDRQDVAEELGIFGKSTKDIMRYIRDHAPLKPWQADILDILYQEALYFAPQRITKALNEGHASWTDHNIMAKQAFCGLGQKTPDSGIIDYADHKTRVLGGKHSTNPYKLGYTLLQDIEERWDKGQFGIDYEMCNNLEQKRDWDQKLGLGHDKVLEVRKYYNDLTALAEFFTPEFCDKHEYFNWKRYPNGDIKLEDRNFKEIKSKLLRKYANGGLPEIRLADPNHKGDGILLLEHSWEGQELQDTYLRAVMQSLYFFWKNEVCLSTKTEDGEEIVYVAYGTDEGLIDVMSREQYETQDADA